MIRRVGDGLVEVTGTAAMFCGPWVKCRVRKAQTCVLTRKIIPPGAEAYRPVTNSSQRSERVKAAEMERYLR
jgi:hypothetical protein